MKGEAEGDSALWIRGQDELGRPIDADIVAAAKRNWKRVLTYAESQRHDGPAAAEALEYVVHSLALLIERHPHARALGRFHRGLPRLPHHAGNAAHLQRGHWIEPGAHIFHIGEAQLRKISRNKPVDLDTHAFVFAALCLSCCRIEEHQ